MQIFQNISVDDWHILHDNAGWIKLNDKIIEKAINNSKIISIKENNKIVGMARLITDKATKGLLCDVIVLHDYQRKGIGSLLIREIIKIIKEDLLCNSCYMLEALPSSDSLNFYIKNGFSYNPQVSHGVYMLIEN